MQFAWDKYGYDCFEFIILDVIWNREQKLLNKTIKNLLANWEQLWLDHYQSYDRKFGYNIRKKADNGTLGYQHSDEYRKKISNSLKKSDKFWAVKRSNEYKQQRSEQMKLAWKNNDQTVKKLVESHLGKSSWNKGKSSWNKGLTSNTDLRVAKNEIMAQKVLKLKRDKIIKKEVENDQNL